MWIPDGDAWGGRHNARVYRHWGVHSKFRSSNETGGFSVVAAWFEMNGYARVMKRLTLQLLRHNLWRPNESSSRNGQFVIVCAHAAYA